MYKASTTNRFANHARLCWAGTIGLVVCSASALVLYAVDTTRNTAPGPQQVDATATISQRPLARQPIPARIDTRYHFEKASSPIANDAHARSALTPTPHARTQLKPVTLGQPARSTESIQIAPRPHLESVTVKDLTQEAQAKSTPQKPYKYTIPHGSNTPTAQSPAAHEDKTTPADTIVLSRIEESDDAALLPVVDQAVEDAKAAQATPPEPAAAVAPIDTVASSTKESDDRLLDVQTPPAINSTAGHDPQRIIGWINVGYTSAERADHLIGRGLKEHGWPRVIERDVAPQLRWGARRFMIHNPFGARSELMVMQFDQFVEAQEAGLDWATKGFVSAWKPVVQGLYTDGQAIEVIGYIGSITQDQEMQALYLSGDLEGWTRRAQASIAPLLEAGMSIAFDAGSLIEEDHPGYDLIRELQSQGVKVYIETYPKADKPHLHDIPVIMLERYLKKVSEKKHLFPLKSDLGHKVARMINGHEMDPDNPNWQVTKSINVLAQGDNLVTNIKWLTDRDMTMQRLFDQAELYSTAAYD